MKRVGIALYDGVQSLDVTGPLEVFCAANAALQRVSAREAYTLVVLSQSGAPVRAESGLLLGADLALRDATDLDTLVVAGGNGVRAVATDPAFVRDLGCAARPARRIASVCTGAFLLAAAGLLRGRRATTHWAYCDTLAALVPSATVVREAIYVRDGPLWTSAGVVAGMDLALALVEDDLGPEIAHQVAKWLVLFVRRAAGQPQISEQMKVSLAQRPDIRDLSTWIVDHPREDLSVASLARRCGMSVRNFSRLFRAQTGLTPARYVEQVRVEIACRLLESTAQSTEEIAVLSGFETTDTLRRALGRRLGVGPKRYRQGVRRSP